MLRNWCWVYLGNFAAALLLAFSHIMTGDFGSGKIGLAMTILETADRKCSLPFSQALILGIFCNILVCLAVMCALMAKSGPSKALAAYLPVAFFVWAGFEHSIANMYYISSGLFLKMLPGMGDKLSALEAIFPSLTWTNFLLKNLIPVTIGNILGGFLYTGLIYLAYRPRKENSC